MHSTSWKNVKSQQFIQLRKKIPRLVFPTEIMFYGRTSTMASRFPDSSIIFSIDHDMFRCFQICPVFFYIFPGVSNCSNFLWHEGLIKTQPLEPLGRGNSRQLGATNRFTQGVASQMSIHYLCLST